jgi:hypothetical protein
VFLKQLLDRTQVQAEVFRREQYKGALAPLMGEKFDEHQRENLTALLKVRDVLYCCSLVLLKVRTLLYCCFILLSCTAQGEKTVVLLLSCTAQGKELVVLLSCTAVSYSSR